MFLFSWVGRLIYGKETWERQTNPKPRMSPGADPPGGNNF
jgi:hypothetical protein